MRRARITAAQLLRAEASLRSVEQTGSPSLHHLLPLQHSRSSSFSSLRRFATSPASGMYPDSFSIPSTPHQTYHHEISTWDVFLPSIGGVVFVFFLNEVHIQIWTYIYCFSGGGSPSRVIAVKGDTEYLSALSLAQGERESFSRCQLVIKEEIRMLMIPLKKWVPNLCTWKNTQTHSE